MRAPIRILWAACLLAAGAGASPRDACAQPVAKASFVPEGSFDLPTSGRGSLERPQALAWSPAGQIHVADERGTITVFDEAGTVVRTYGGGTLQKVASVALDELGRAYVLDPDERVVLVFDASGEVIHRIGSRGSEAGRLDEPLDVAVGPAGLIYILDKGRRGVQVFSLDGTFVHDIVLPQGADDPRALGVSPAGDVYVADKSTPGAIIALPNLTVALAVLDAPSPAADRLPLRGAGLREPVAVVATPTGTILAADRDSGILWSADATEAEPAGSDDRVYGGKGSGRGSFRRLVDVALAGTDELVILDRDGRKVERIRLVLEADRPALPAQDYPVQFQTVSPELAGGVIAMAPTGKGTLWYALTDVEGRNIRVLEADMQDRSGVFGSRIRIPEPSPGRPTHAFGQTVERAGDAALNDTLLVVTEPRRNRFHVFDLRTDQLIGSFGDNYSDDRRLRSPRGVALFPDGRIAVADHDNGRIAVFSADVASLLGTFAIPKAEGVTISAENRMLAWDEDGLFAGEFPLTGGALRPLPSSMASGGVGALAVDRAGNLYSLRRGSGRVAIADASLERLLARVGGRADLERGDHLTVDPDGNIYATDIERGRTVVRRWGVDVPAIPEITVTWDSDAADLQWPPVEGSFITGYQVEGATALEGPWAAEVTTTDPRTRIESTDNLWFRVAARTLTGAQGQPSPPGPALNLAVQAAFEGGAWDDARDLAREALDLLDSGDVEATASVAPELAWQGFVAAHEAGDFEDVLVWQETLDGHVPQGRAFDHAARLADAYQRTGDLNSSTDWALAAIRTQGRRSPPANPERVRALREMVFENGPGLRRWADVAEVGEDLLQAANGEADPEMVASLARAHLNAGSPERALDLARAELEETPSEEQRRTFAVLAFVAAADLGDIPMAEEYAAQVGDSIPGSLFVEFESALARVKLAKDDVDGARSEVLFLLLGQDDDIRALVYPRVADAVLELYGRMIEAGQVDGSRRMLDTLVSALPADLAPEADLLIRRADSVGVVADTRGKLGEGIAFYRDALFRDALRFFQEADGRTDLDVDQRLMVKEFLAAVFHSLGRVEDADNVYRGVYEVEPDFVLADHHAHVETTYGVSVFTPAMLEHFATIGPIM